MYQPIITEWTTSNDPFDKQKDDRIIQARIKEIEVKRTKDGKPIDSVWLPIVEHKATSHADISVAYASEDKATPEDLATLKQRFSGAFDAYEKRKIEAAELAKQHEANIEARIEAEVAKKLAAAKTETVAAVKKPQGK